MAIAPDPFFAASSVAHNEAVLAELVGAIVLGQGAMEITLLIIRCNGLDLQDVLVATLLAQLQTESLQGQVHVLRFDQTCDRLDSSGWSSTRPLKGRDIFKRLQATMQTGIPGAVILLGLETTPLAEQLWVDLNPWREEFRHTFPFPVLLWLTDDGYGKFSYYANDFESISGGPSLKVALPSTQLT